MKILKLLWDVISMVVGALLLSMMITVFLFQPYKVEGESMYPTLLDQQRIYVSKINHTFKIVPSYGDIVIIDSRFDHKRTLKDDFLESPLAVLLLKNQADYYYVKRVIGKPGDLIEIDHGKVYRNGQLLDEPYINGPMAMTAYQKWTIPENHIFVMGDNRNHSTDSRVLGYCPLDHVIGIKLF
jgi:signal peptidase I